MRRAGSDWAHADADTTHADISNTDGTITSLTLTAYYFLGGLPRLAQTGLAKSSLHVPKIKSMHACIRMYQAYIVLISPAQSEPT